jgi:hypothetical protein
LALLGKGFSMSRLDSRLEATGAEFLVLGQLLIQGIQCYKSYVNCPGYDLIAVNPNNKKVVTIQVKSRWATDFNKSFPIDNFECDFVVLVALNRGLRYRKVQKVDLPRDPEFYIFPVTVVKRAQSNSGKWNVAKLSEMDDYSKYKNKWALVEKQLK